jgi:hypothetical protein
MNSSIGDGAEAGNRPHGRLRRLWDAVVSFIARLLGLQVPPYVPPEAPEGEGSSMMDQPYQDHYASDERYRESQAALARLRNTYHTKTQPLTVAKVKASMLARSDREDEQRER